MNNGSMKKVKELIKKGVDIPGADNILLGDEVDVKKISAKGVTIYPGCRIFGQDTVISENTRIGYEAPATIENCRLGPGVELRGGFFKGSVFLERSYMGSGAHVREGCLVEEQAGGAHCVGLKQTILFPFVTLGSLVNFCDCLMAGGTSRKDHSEVGSSFIHFNFTPDGDKATPSLIGDVPGGVMLNRPPIFLGGQGGLVGPARIGFGNVVAAGSMLRKDFLEENRLIVTKPHRGIVTEFSPGQYQGLARIVKNNIIYLANLVALEKWYMNIRKPFFTAQELGGLMFEGALKTLVTAKKERSNRLSAMVKMIPIPEKKTGRAETLFRDLHHNIKDICEVFTEYSPDGLILELQDEFCGAFERQMEKGPSNYIDAVQSLSAGQVKAGVEWLNRIVSDLCMKTGRYVPSVRF